MGIDLNEILEAVRSHGFWSEERSRYHDTHYKAHVARPERHSSDPAVCGCNADSKMRYIGAVNAQRNALESIAAAVQKEVDAEREAAS